MAEPFEPTETEGFLPARGQFRDFDFTQVLTAGNGDTLNLEYGLFSGDSATDGGKPGHRRPTASTRRVRGSGMGSVYKGRAADASGRGG